jgi:hypothetical protein
MRPDPTVGAAPPLEKRPRLIARLNTAAAAIPLLGLSAAICLFLTASDSPEDALSYEIINGVAYPIARGDSKLYEFQIERMSGKFGILVDQFTGWFATLWHGKSLAYLIAGGSLVTGLLLWYLARELAADLAYRNSRPTGSRSAPD